MYDENNGITWVIMALNNSIADKKARENHKYDEVRADQDLSWCPVCECKWEIYEGRIWASHDVKLYEEKICPDCQI